MNKNLILLILILITKYSVAQTADSLYVFVGEKIAVSRYNPADEDPDTMNRKNKIYFDEAFHAKYRVIKNVFNKITSDTIYFDAFDHYGTPPFSKYRYVLLFVSKENGKFYHEKYQFYNVYQTKNGRWASPGDPYAFDQKGDTEVKAVPLDFKEPVTFDVSKISPENIKRYYPAPYYKIEGGKAIALMGNYVEELFIVKKEGVLEARGIF
ncbi:hypothetical protein [Mucilaginibacter psychrotolerans]|uniref:Uncharacterized protein n=1 Tax=Mucilaginibacter psychrotolerans TaxID=1524096 RepID=A0A4Y8S7L8_9SPHI|nr:hypothetical protein [Mucilaginibacter psychrotolerans]TFF35023.1 hypothetical protein E2R66_19965 [Mucilaginibacter psychrotolerans]